MTLNRVYHMAIPSETVEALGHNYEHRLARIILKPLISSTQNVKRKVPKGPQMA